MPLSNKTPCDMDHPHFSVYAEIIKANITTRLCWKKNPSQLAIQTGHIFCRFTIIEMYVSAPLIFPLLSIGPSQLGCAWSVLCKGLSLGFT